MATIYKSFQALSEAEFATYAAQIIGYSRSATKRKEAVAYLQSINSADKVLIDAERSSVVQKTLHHRQKQKQIETLLDTHDFDFEKTPDIFSNSVLSDADMVTKLTQNNESLYIAGKAFVGDLAISGDKIRLDGENTIGTAKDETLTFGASVNGSLILSGEDVYIRGIDFSTSNDKAVITNGAKNVTFVNCKFKSVGGAGDTWWFFGDGMLDKSSVTVQNCIIEGFTSVHLADYSTTSAIPTTRLDLVKIEDCLFKNNAGSMASRGKQDDPNLLGIFRRNKVITDTMHASWWDATEFNNTKKVIITDNEFIFPIGTEALPNQKRGVAQVWSKSPKPWILQYKNNVVSNIKFGLKIPLTDNFYAPNTDSDDFFIDFSSLYTNVTYVFSLLYKKNDGTQVSALKYHPNVGNEYSPVNIAVVPTITAVNPSGYSLVLPS